MERHTDRDWKVTQEAGFRRYSERDRERDGETEVDRQTDRNGKKGKEWGLGSV